MKLLESFKKDMLILGNNENIKETEDFILNDEKYMSVIEKIEKEIEKIKEDKNISIEEKLEQLIDFGSFILNKDGIYKNTIFGDYLNENKSKGREDLLEGFYVNLNHHLNSEIIKFSLNNANVIFNNENLLKKMNGFIKSYKHKIDYYEYMSVEAAENFHNKHGYFYNKYDSFLKKFNLFSRKDMLSVINDFANNVLMSEENNFTKNKIEKQFISNFFLNYLNKEFYFRVEFGKDCVDFRRIDYGKTLINPFLLNKDGFLSFYNKENNFFKEVGHFIEIAEKFEMSKEDLISNKNFINLLNVLNEMNEKEFFEQINSSEYTYYNLERILPFYELIENQKEISINEKDLEILKKFKENFKKVIDKYHEENPNFLLNAIEMKVKSKEIDHVHKKNVI